MLSGNSPIIARWPLHSRTLFLREFSFIVMDDYRRNEQKREFERETKFELEKKKNRDQLIKTEKTN
ncbi:unnamed protein product [Thlaspi arvense]|uniref:Uncharacterized protein n=1 Tax=Thlaspi arvense TaxID=13288 RepID=A0AAU9SF98_THLAR|nr:unnamed protein product [Thlaspi arvense]